MITGWNAPPSYRLTSSPQRRWRHRSSASSRSDPATTTPTTRRTHDALLGAFAAGVMATAGGSRALAATGGLVGANAILDAFATAALPRDYARPTWARRNAANTVVMAVGVGCFMAAMATGAAAVRGRFRAFSLGIPISYGLLTALSLLRLRPSGGGPSSTGAQERTMAYSYELWIAVLAILLLRRGRGRPARDDLRRRMGRRHRDPAAVSEAYHPSPSPTLLRVPSRPSGGVRDFPGLRTMC